MSIADRETTNLIHLILATGNIYGVELTPNGLELYCEALRDLPFNEIRDAFLCWVKKNTEFPTPADIRKLIAMPEQQAPQSEEEDA